MNYKKINLSKIDLQLTNGHWANISIANSLYINYQVQREYYFFPVCHWQNNWQLEFYGHLANMEPFDGLTGFVFILWFCFLFGVKSLSLSPGLGFVFAFLSFETIEIINSSTHTHTWTDGHRYDMLVK